MMHFVLFQSAQTLLDAALTSCVISFEQQERWRRDRAQLSLDPATSDFCTGGLFALLDGHGLAVVVLPADVLAQPVDFDDRLRDPPGPVCGADRQRSISAVWVDDHFYRPV